MLHWHWGRMPTVAIIGDSNVERFPPRHPFLNLGLTHTTSKDFAERIGPCLARPNAFAVKTVVIWGPTNDIHYWNGNGTQYLREAGSTAAAAGKRVILCTVCPHIDQSQPGRGRSHDEISAGIVALNQNITALAGDMRWGLADCHAALVDRNGVLIPDMFLAEDADPPTLLHLSKAGIKTCLDAIRARISVALCGVIETMEPWIELATPLTALA